MRTALACFYEAFPPASGAASVSYHVARHLPGERLLLQVADRPAMLPPDRGLTVDSLLFPAHSAFGKICRLPACLGAIVESIVRFDADLVVLEGASWVVYHWLLLRALRRRSPRLPVFYHAHNVEADLRRAKNGRAIAALTRWAEGRLLRGADRAFAVSAVDARRFKALYGIEPTLLPNGVDVAQFDAATEEHVATMRARHGIGPHALLFMGLYAYRPNTEAVEFLVNDVMPRLLQSHPDAQLVVTGGETPHRLPWLKNPGMLPFEDMPALIRACGAGVVPIFSGSGTRLKILECMAAGVPVVSTPKGAEGLEVADGRSILLGRDGAEFAGHLRSLWNDPALGAGLIEQARQLVRERYDWPRCVRPLVEQASECRLAQPARPSGRIQG